MKLISALAVTAVSAGRIRRSPQGGAGNAAPGNTWTYIEYSGSEVLEGNWYMIGGQGTADEAHAFCANQGGFAPLSRTPSVLSVYNSFPNVNGAYWSGFKKVNSVWEVFQSANPADTGTAKQPWTANNPACRGFLHGGTTVCAKPEFSNGQWCINQEACDWNDATILCLKNADAPPADINSIVDAWNDMVTFPNASTHGCQCLNLLSDAGQRYPGQPRDELDHVCLDWQNAIKCQRFEGGVCGSMKEDELPSYTNYANCTLNNDPCAAALCEINRKFSTDINNLNGVITPTEVEEPAANCTRAQAGPKYDSCCLTDVFSSNRYDSASQKCVNGAVQHHCQDKVIDAVFIIDGSSSVDDREYALQQAFTRDLAQKIGLGSSRASVVQYSWEPLLVMNWTSDAAAFAGNIMAMQQPARGGTWTQDALRFAYTNLIQGQKRTGIPMVVYLMTDGKSTPRSDPVTNMSTYATETVTSFALGIGSKAKFSELLTVASEPAYVSNNIEFDDLEDQVVSAAANMCLITE